jgi:hypothetical protein
MPRVVGGALCGCSGCLLAVSLVGGAVDGGRARRWQGGRQGAIR